MNGNGERHVSSLVAQASRRIKFATLALGACWWLVTALGVWLLLFILDNLLGLPAGLRLPLAVGGALLSAVGFAKRIWLPAARKLRPEHVALMLESRYAVPENLLINAYQFESRQFRPEEKMFARHTIVRCDEEITRVQFRDLWEPKQLTTWGVSAGLVLVAWLIYAVLFPAYLSNAGLRFVKPLSDVPPASAVTLKLTPETDITVPEGDNLDVRVEVIGRQAVPVIVWQENVAEIPSSKAAGENADMAVEKGIASRFLYTFANVRRSFALRVFAANTYTRSVRVRVRPLPRLTASALKLTPPAYTGLSPVTSPGPPATVSALPGSKLGVSLEVQPAVVGPVWKEAGKVIAFTRTAKNWNVETLVETGGIYEVAVTDPGLGRTLTIARSSISLLSDNPPIVEFLTEDRNRFVSLGATVKLDVQAKDDFGIRGIQITAHTVDQDPAKAKILKTWIYIGPPGNMGPLKETAVLTVDPKLFEAGSTYLIEALAGDFKPGGQLGKSRPIVLRIKSPGDLSIAAGDPLATAFEALKRTIARQTKANGLTANLQIHIDEAVAKRDLVTHQKVMGAAQEDARVESWRALGEFKKVAEGKLYASVLAPLVSGEMPWALGDIGKLTQTKTGALPDLLKTVADRQNYILSMLLSLLGQIADARKEVQKPDKEIKSEKNSPALAAKDLMKDLNDELPKFISEQEKILERSKTMMNKRPEDLTKDDEKILGELAREESNWSKYFEEKLTDFAKLSQQDFADPAMAKELKSVFQDVQQAAGDLYAKKTENAVPVEQTGLENAKSLEQNLEKALAKKPDTKQWNLEEPLKPADIAMADLPAELEDLTGALLDKEEQMTPDVEDVSSSWLDSKDKVGGPAADGPMSDMSAKGITGNLLPNQMDVGGRSGEGRTGQSTGQMIQDTAEGKGGRETPSRMTPTPYEQGAVKDSDTKSLGGATGGGKLSGFGAEGLRGPPPPPSDSSKAPRLAEQQAKIRQQAEALALKLRQYKLPSGDLETSVMAMKQLEGAIQKHDGIDVRRAFSRAVDALASANQSMKTETGLYRERTKLPSWMRDEIMTGFQDGTPRGYEEMISAYFRALAEKEQK